MVIMTCYPFVHLFFLLLGEMYHILKMYQLISFISRPLPELFQLSWNARMLTSSPPPPPFECSEGGMRGSLREGGQLETVLALLALEKFPFSLPLLVHSTMPSLFVLLLFALSLNTMHNQFLTIHRLPFSLFKNVSFYIYCVYCLNCAAA